MLFINIFLYSCILELNLAPGRQYYLYTYKDKAGAILARKCNSNLTCQFIVKQNY